MHEYHQDQDYQQIEWKQRYCDVIGNQPEQRRHQTGAHIGAGHLDTDNRLRFFRAEVVRRGMDNAGVDGSTAKPNQNQSCEGGVFPQRQQKSSNSNRDDSLSQPDELRVAELHSQEAVKRPSICDANKKQTGKAGCCFRRNALLQHQIAAGP